MDDTPPTIQPPTLPEASTQNPYSAPVQPPMLPQHSVVDESGLTQDEKSMGMLIHLLSLLTGFLGVIILWAVKKNDSKFVDFHGREAMNFMISMVLYTFALVIVSLLLGLVTMGFGMFLIMPFAIVLGIGSLVLEIMACIKASQGEWHRYPMSIRFIPDAR